MLACAQSTAVRPGLGSQSRRLSVSLLHALQVQQGPFVNEAVKGTDE